VSRSASPAATGLAAGGWGGLVLFLAWQEIFHEKWFTAWWFRVPATAMLALVILVFALECLSQEMTVRRWATSALVFAVFGALFVAAGILKSSAVGLPGWVLVPVGLYYLASAAAAAAAAKDAL
jgi:hypothetical protein